jgi:predicted DNA-binding transcriptional regulator AlpA
MANSTQQAESQQILNGWKEIANHLGKGVRTVQRYERDLGLPVRRPTRESAVVFAITSEIDAWVEACPMRVTVRSMATMPESSGGATVQTLKKNVEEMRRLGKQMQELRGDLRYSLEMLRTSLRFVETDAHAELPQASASGLATSLEALGMRTNSNRSYQMSVPRS